MVFIKLGTLAFVVPITKRENIKLTYGKIFYNLTFLPAVLHSNPIELPLVSEYFYKFYRSETSEEKKTETEHVILLIFLINIGAPLDTSFL